MEVNLRQLNYGMGKFSPKLTTILVDMSGGLKNYKKHTKEVRYIMIGMAWERFRREIINKFGSNKAYMRFWYTRLRKQTGMRVIDYRNLKAQENGFENDLAYQNFLYQKQGFKDKYDHARFKRLKKKFGKSFSDFTIRAIQFANEGNFQCEKELQEFILARKNCGLIKKMERESKRISTRGNSRLGIPTLRAVCGTQNGGSFDSQQSPSKGLVVRRPSPNVSYTLDKLNATESK